MKLSFFSRYDRPETIVPNDLLEENLFYKFEVIDETITKNLPEGFKKYGCKDIARSYEQMTTQMPQVTDGDVMDYQDGEIIISTMETIMATLYNVLSCYFNGSYGPLKKVKTSGQENINLGYIEAEDRTHVIYLELKSHEPGKKAILHLHESECPRQYKENRHMLLKQKGS